MSFDILAPHCHRMEFTLAGEKLQRCRTALPDFDGFNPEQLRRIIPRFAAWATPASNWLIADFQTPCAGLQRIRARLILWTIFAFLRAMTRLPAHKLTPPDSLLERAGFSLHRRT